MKGRKRTFLDTSSDVLKDLFLSFFCIDRIGNISPSKLTIRKLGVRLKRRGRATHPRESRRAAFLASRFFLNIFIIIPTQNIHEIAIHRSS